MRAESPPLLSPAHVALIDQGVSAIVCSRDLAHRPSVMRAVGSAIAADASVITVYLARPQSRQLLNDIASTGRISVMFSEPSTHRTVQVKATRAQLRDVQEADLPKLARYLAAMKQAIDAIGFPSVFAEAMLAYDPDDLVAVSFQPEMAFEQTPGPKAGTHLNPAGGAGT